MSNTTKSVNNNDSGDWTDWSSNSTTAPRNPPVGRPTRVIKSSSSSGTGKISRAKEDRGKHAIKESTILTEEDIVPYLDCPISGTSRDWFRFVCRLDSYLVKLQQSCKSMDQFESQSQLFFQLTRLMLDSCMHICMTDIQFYIQFNVDQQVWRTALYENISIVRADLSEKNASSRGGHFMLKLIDMGRCHFRDLIDVFQAKIPIDLTSVLKRTGFIFPSCALKQKAAKIIYRLFIYIGDLCRYGFQLRLAPNFRKQATDFYEMARLVDITQGRAFHQLGVIATYMHDFIGITYYFLRASLSTNPTQSSRLDLQEVFFQAFEARQKVKEKYWYALSKVTEKCVRYDRNFQREVWVLPEKDKRKVPSGMEGVPPTKKEHVASLGSTDLYDRFAQTYVLSMGKVCTNIGMDSFEEVAEESLVYFEGLLNRGVKISFARFMQTVALGICAVDSLDGKGVGTASHSAQIAYNRTAAVAFILEMFSLAAERLLKLLDLCDWKNPQIDYLSAAVTVWCDWLIEHGNLWNKGRCRPVFSIRRVEKNRGANAADLTDDVWVIFSQLMTKLEVIIHRRDLCVFPQVRQIATDLFRVPVSPLPEMVILLGLSCFRTEIYDLEYFTTKRSMIRRAQLFLRLNNILKYGKESFTPMRVLQRNSEASRFSHFQSIVKLHKPKKDSEMCGLSDKNFWFWAQDLLHKPKKFPKLRPDCNNGRVVWRKPVNNVPSHPPCFDWTPMQRIWWKIQQKGYYGDIYVRPTRIVVDTNCYINKLEWVKRLVKLFPFKIILPVSVLLELKGLSKGGLRLRYVKKFANDMHNPEAREMMIEGNATAVKVKEALDFIGKNMKHFVITTTTGRTLNLRSFSERVQDDFFDPKETNDDRIIKTVKCIEVNDKSLRCLDNPRRIFRNTVLLTGDRCLRIRSFAEDIPGREIESVVFWVSRFGIPPQPSLQSKPTGHGRSRQYSGGARKRH